MTERDVVPYARDMRLNPATLQLVRERSGMTKAELADRAGIDRTLVTRLENGERTGTPAVIAKLATALQCSQVALCSLDAEQVAS